MYEYKAKVIRVIDGDTIEVMIDLGFEVFAKEKIRFARIDTPETHGVKKESAEYQAGMVATNFVIDWMNKCNHEIMLKTSKNTDGGFGRFLAEVYIVDKDGETENLNDLLLEKGLAELYDK